MGGLRHHTGGAAARQRSRQEGGGGRLGPVGFEAQEREVRPGPASTPQGSSRASLPCPPFSRGPREPAVALTHSVT